MGAQKGASGARAVGSAAFQILGICGSLRRASYNRGLLRAAQELARQTTGGQVPSGVRIDAFGIGDLPLFNQDLEQDPPDPVVRLKAGIRKADALLFATPETNYSIPGVLKNAIDWASRPHGDNAFQHKPVAVMGASIGMSGTMRAQLALRHCFVFTDSYCLPQPECLVPNCTDKFDEDGNLTDQATKEHVRNLVVALVEWAKRF